MTKKQLENIADPLIHLKETHLQKYPDEINSHAITLNQVYDVLKKVGYNSEELSREYKVQLKREAKSFLNKHNYDHFFYIKPAMSLISKKAHELYNK